MANSSQERAVAVLSGGLDSAIATAMAQKELSIVLAVTFDYGQKAAQREWEASEKIASFLGIPHKKIELPWLSTLGSGLTSTGDVPQPTGNDLDDLSASLKSAKAVWVPNRNGVFISVAAAIAESLDAKHVVLGFNREEGATFPDNTREFMTAASRALAFSTANGVEVISPTSGLDKTEIVAKAVALAFPLNEIWSCYLGGEKPCGLCESCQRLHRALRANGVDNVHFH